MGATVIGTVSTADKARLAAANGCDYPINYTTEDFAKDRDWKEHQLDDDDRDEQQIVARFLGGVTKIGKQGGGIVDRSIGELLRLALGKATFDSEVDERDAVHQLKRLGVSATDDETSVYIAHRNAELEKIFRGTPWERNWHSTFERLDGATSCTARFAAGRFQKAIAIPLTTLFPETGAT